jgi:hypothetical protein
LTQDEILDALHKVVQENKHYTTWTVSTPHLVALVKLAIEHEREACIVDIQMCIPRSGHDTPEMLFAKKVMERIRARGDNK